MTLKSILADATTRLNNDEAALEAQLLLQHALNVNRAWLIAHENDALEANKHAVFEALLQRRLNGEPIAYILGYREFYGLKLKTTPDTLIPRPDTETLVEAALANISLTPTLSRLREREQDTRLRNIKENSALIPPLPRGERGRGEGDSQLNTQPSPSPQPSPTLGGGSKMDSRFRGNDGVSNSLDNSQPFSILDLGTGTGAIALAIAHNRPQAFVTAIDASENALNIAQQNAQSLNIANVEFIQSNWFSALSHQKFDLIVSNPPYIEEDDKHLSQGDLRFEPLSALASGSDGLRDIKQIITQAPHYLKPSAWLMLEHGYDQAEKVAKLLVDAGFSEIETIKDLGGNARVTLGRLNNS